ncbi:hypothetical protein [Streptomyces wedmorensis]|uniref:hypothetical protein n=1 Tax=Streptomyces wedmorensis TaxID=43759 RepID=UPI0037A3DFC1
MPAFSPQAWQTRPHMVAAASFPGRLLGAVKQVLGEASGNRWFYATAGTPAQLSLMEGMAPSQIDANFSLAAGPFGWQLGGLFGMGATTDQHSSVVVRSRMTSLRSLLYVDDNHGLEISCDAQFHAGWQRGGSTGVSWSFAAGGGRAMNAAGEGVSNAEAGGGDVRFIVKSGLSGQDFGRSDSSAATVQRTATRSTVLGHSGRTVLLIGSVDWTVAAASRGTGFLAPSVRCSERWAATVVTNDAGVLIWMAEQDALVLGLIDDHLGELPGWNEQVWREPDWSEGVPPFSFDAGTFDMSALLDAFTTRADASRRETPTGTTVSFGCVPRPVRPGTPAHAVLTNALDAGSLQAFFHEAVEHGMAVTLYDTALFGNTDLELRLAPRVEFDGAVLLAVDHGNDLSDGVKTVESAARSDSSVDSRHPTVTGGPAFITGDPLFNRVGSSAAAPTGTTTDAITQDPDVRGGGQLQAETTRRPQPDVPASGDLAGGGGRGAAPAPAPGRRPCWVSRPPRRSRRVSPGFPSTTACWTGCGRTLPSKAAW